MCTELIEAKYTWGYEPPCYDYSSLTNSISIQRANWLQARCWLTQRQWPCTTTFYYICSYLSRIRQSNSRAEKVACGSLAGGRLISPKAAKGLKSNRTSSMLPGLNCSSSDSRVNMQLFTDGTVILAKFSAYTFNIGKW